MKKSRLLTALLLCTAVALQANTANATDVSSWGQVERAFQNGGDYTLTQSINVKIVPDIEPDGTESSNSAFFDINNHRNVNFDLGGNTITSTQSESENPIFSIGDLFTDDIQGDSMTMINGTITNHTGFPIGSPGNNDAPSTGTIGVYNSRAVKQLSVDFKNNSNEFGGAIANMTGNISSVKSVISNVSGEFTSNNAKYLGGAIYNTGIFHESEAPDGNNWIIKSMHAVRDLESKVSITTNGKDTVFNGNTAGMAGGAIFNNGTVDISSKDGNQVIFKTASDTIYNNGILNLTSGEVFVNSEITDKELHLVIGDVLDTTFGGQGITNIADGATLTLGDGATITQQEINVSGALYAENSGNLTGKLSISETGTADLNADTLTSTVYNDGDLALWGGTLKQNIQGEGITAILGEVTNNATITQDVFGIEKEDGFSNGVFTTNINNLVVGEKKIHNYGTLKLTGGTNNYDITSTDTDNNTQAGGKTIIAGDVINNGTIAQAIEIESGSLTTDVAKINGNIKNDAVLTLNGIDAEITEDTVIDNTVVSSLTSEITGNGKTVLNNNILINENLETELEINGVVQTDKVLGKSGKNITVKSGTLSAEQNAIINGKLNIEKGAYALVDNASSLTDETVNNGSITLGINTLNKNITGNGRTVICGGTVTNNAIIEQAKLEIDYVDGQVTEPSVLITNADNLKISEGIQNAGTLKLNGGTLNANIANLVEDNTTHVGKTEIIGEVTNNAKISQDVDITSGKLTSNADNITGTVDVKNGATYNLTGGALTETIKGAGNLQLASDFTSIAMSGFTGNVNVAQGKTLTVGNGVFENASAINMSNGSTLNMMDKNVTQTEINNLAIANGNVVNLKFDWGDTLNSSSDRIGGNFNVTEVDLTSTTGEKEEYVFTTTLNDKIVLDENIKLNATETSNNAVVYDALKGSMASKKLTLAGAVVDETSDSIRYTMTGNESGDNQTLTGNLTVQGNGNSITGGGIIVGDNKTSGAVLTLEDVNFDAIKVEGDSKGAIHVNGGNELNLVAKTSDLNIQGSKGNTTNAIYLQGDETKGYAKATINAQGGTITISDDIMSNNASNEVVFTGTKDITFTGKFDPVLATVDMDKADLVRGGQDEDITWNLNGGTLRYTEDKFLSGGTNSVNFNGGSLDLRNGSVNTVDLASLTLSQNSDLYLDVDLAKETMDMFNTENINIVNDKAVLNVAGLSLISDATKDETSINFVPEETGLTGYVNYTGASELKALSPMYKYNVAYDNKTGDFNFARVAGGGYGSYNPGLFASPVAAQLGGYLTQLNAYDEAFRNMDMYMLMTKKQREALKLRNKYAAADGNLTFDPTSSMYDRKGAWFRPYTTFENVPLKGGPRVSNVSYGTFFGGESELYDLGNGWDGMIGVYAGYNGSHQSYNGVGIYQNGGTLGVTGMAYKGNYFAGATINAGANAGEANTSNGADNFTMLMAGIAAKTGYNWELADGKFIIQPSYMMSYSFVNTFDYTNAGGVRIDSDPLNAIQIEPGVKFIGNLKNGWQPYAGISVVWNIMDKTDFKANNVSLPELSIKPYVKYGIGVRKSWGERFTGFFQTFFTNGGRNGIGFQAGFRWSIGKDPSSVHTGNSSPELPKAEIKLSNGR